MNKEFFIQKFANLFRHKPTFIEQEASRLSGKPERNHYGHRGLGFMGISSRLAESSRTNKTEAFDRYNF